MKVALVYDHVNKIGGAERILEALHKIYPKAPLYTLVYDSEKAPWADKFKIIPSFLQKIPLAKSFHEFFPVIPVFAFENLNFNKFDLVISITSAEAKGIITGPETLHICYCLTPTRYLWSHYRDYFPNKFISTISAPVIAVMRLWDMIASKRPDKYIAISKHISQRILKYYCRNSYIIYPPVDLKKFNPKNDDKPGKYFLVVSRLVKYKHIEIAINACNKLKLPLKIIGSGLEKSNLLKIAGSTIDFVGNLTDSQLISYYQNCRALIFPQEEDLGITAVEAQACGKPVIAYSSGGATEIIKDHKSGEFFCPQTDEALMEKLKVFDDKKYKSESCRKQAELFEELKFKKHFSKFIKNTYDNYFGGNKI